VRRKRDIEKRNSQQAYNSIVCLKVKSKSVIIRKEMTKDVGKKEKRRWAQ